MSDTSYAPNFVYILGSTAADGHRTYVGWTTNLERRLEQHNTGVGARSTRGRKWRLLYAERHPTKNDAMSREWHLKRDRRFRKMLAENCLIFSEGMSHEHR